MDGPEPNKEAERPKRSRWRYVLVVLVVIASVLGVVRAILPGAVEWYVNRTIDQHPMYDGRIDDIDIHLWRGAYTIEKIDINKVTGNVPVPLFAAEKVDLRVQWDALLSGELVGQIVMIRPQLNFVDGEDQSEDQTGEGGPWLQIIDELFPFRINSCLIRDGSIHFRAFDAEPPVDVYLSEVEASIENLGNIHDDVAPLVATVDAKALAMDHAELEYHMKLDPTSYRPTFQMAVRLVGLDVTKVNALSRAYGAFDFERGWFDLVVELDAKEGRVEGYVKPLFRNLKVLSLREDVEEDNLLEVFWEALVGVTTEVLENQPRDQFATRIPLEGDLAGPDTSILTVVGNVLRNAFLRAYLPQLEGEAEDIEGLEFGPGEPIDPVAVGQTP